MKYNEKEICLLKRMVDLINEKVDNQEGSLGDFMYRIEVDYQQWFNLNEENFDLAKSDPFIVNN